MDPAVFNREARVRFEKIDKKENATPVEDKILHPDTVKLIFEQGRKTVKYLALTTVSVYATIKLLDTASQIAVKKTKSADQD